MEQAQLVYGNLESVDIIGVMPEKDRLCRPSCSIADDGFNCQAAHEIEAFGPVSTLMPYKNTDEAIALVKLRRVHCAAALPPQTIALPETT